MPLLGFLFTPLGRYLIIGIAAVAIVGGAYTKGRFDGRAAYKAKIEREIKNAIDKGDAARERALRDFDASPDELSDDGFRRP